MRIKGYYGKELNRAKIYSLRQEGFNALYLSPRFTDGDFTALRSLYDYAKSLGYIKFYIDVSWGMWPIDQNDNWYKVMHLFAVCPDVEFYNDEPQVLLNYGLSLEQIKELFTEKMMAANCLYIPMKVSITERTRGSEIHNILIDIFGEENIVYSSYYLSFLHFTKSTPFIWQLGQFSLANAPVSGALVSLLIGAMSLLFGFTFYYLLLLPLLAFMPFFPLWRAFAGLKGINSAMLYSSNMPEWSADGWEQKTLQILGFCSNILITFTEWLNRKLFILFF